jgi:hypothetical protein
MEESDTFGPKQQPGDGRKATNDKDDSLIHILFYDEN